MTHQIDPSPANSSRKRHTACDECRSRKLKCSGNPAGCERCTRDGTLCNYSEKKVMGRPRKRRALSQDISSSSSSSSSSANDGTSGTPPMQIAFPELELELELSQPFQAAVWPSLEQIPVSPSAQNPDWLSVFDDLFLPARLDSPMPSQPPAPSPDTETPLPPTIAPPHDPVLTPFLPPALTPNPFPCACIPTLFTTLSSLTSLTPTFPLALPSLRAATASVRSILHCATCSAPRTPSSHSFQNTLLLATLIPHISAHYTRLLAGIDASAARSDKKRLRIGEVDNPAVAGPHTGQEGCAAGVEVEMDAGAWRGMMRGVVGREVRGLVDVVGEMEERGRRWHERGKEMLGFGGCEEMVRPACMTVVEMTRMAVEEVGVN